MDLYHVPRRGKNKANSPNFLEIRIIERNKKEEYFYQLPIYATMSSDLHIFVAFE